MVATVCTSQRQVWHVRQAFPQAELAAVHLSSGLFLAPAAAAPRTNLRKFSLAASYVAAGLLARRLWPDNPMPASLAPLRYPAWCTRGKERASFGQLPVVLRGQH